jgi:hypothetical protein
VKEKINNCMKISEIESLDQDTEWVEKLNDKQWDDATDHTHEDEPETVEVNGTVIRKS